jgi:hypothetical protein
LQKRRKEEQRMSDKTTDEKKEKPMTKNQVGTWDLLGAERFIALMKRQWGLILLIVVLAIFYVDNRYTVQRQQIKIDKLKKELEKEKYIDLTRSSQLMEISRQSKIEEYVQKNNSDLQTSTEPPYLIVDKKQ